MLTNFKREIAEDLYNELKSDLNSNKNSFLNEAFHYISKQNNELASKFGKHKEYANFVSTLNEKTKDLAKEINEYVQKLIEEQEKQIEKSVTDILNKSDTLTLDQINDELFNAKRNISEFTREKANKINDLTQDKIKDTLETFNQKTTQAKLPNELIEKLVKDYRYDINRNIGEPANAFADRSSNEVERYYENAKEKFKEMKEGELDLSKTSSVTTENEITKGLEDEKKDTTNKVKVDDLKLYGFTDIETLQLYINTLSPVTLSEKDGFLVVMDENGIEEDASIKEEDGKVFLKLHNKNEQESYGIDLDSKNKSISIKKGENGVVYDMNKNELQAKTSDKKYLFRFENGKVVSYYTDDQENEIKANFNQVLEELKKSGIKIEDVIKDCLYKSSSTLMQDSDSSSLDIEEELNKSNEQRS
ncbi:MAG: hypothetical protein IKX00_01145 [Bacilli bacterium]|nr:hypothetical protein [Bacilli bacterium]